MEYFEGHSHLWQYGHFQQSDRETAGTWPVFICMLYWFLQGIWYYKSNLLNGLLNFCSNNQMIVNVSTKTEVMCFDKAVKSELYFNNKEI